MELTGPTFDRARELVARGMRAADAVHSAAAEALRADVLLTCDDQLWRVGQRLAGELNVRIANPVEWLKEQLDATNPG